ncbi:hypothetical protein OG21DRAFT_1323540 [Imleria badia]|nr:hypothetical protein OG21DRAFT_1323540 [Imleria badia]
MPRLGALHPSSPRYFSLICPCQCPSPWLLPIPFRPSPSLTPTTESLVVLPTLGIQLEIRRGRGHPTLSTTHHFIPLSTLDDKY